MATFPTVLLPRAWGSLHCDMEASCDTVDGSPRGALP